MNTPKPKNTLGGKHKHKLEYPDPCPNCGWDEGQCKKCGKYVMGENGELQE